MKVLKKGREQKGWAKEFTCTGAGNGNGGCEARLLVERGDLFHTYNCWIDGSEEYYVTFRCSECGVLTDAKGTPFRGSELPHYRSWCKARGVSPK